MGRLSRSSLGVGGDKGDVAVLPCSLLCGSRDEEGTAFEAALPLVQATHI